MTPIRPPARIEARSAARPVAALSLALVLLLLPLASTAAEHGGDTARDYARPGFYGGVAGAYGAEAFGDLVGDILASFGLPTATSDSGGLNARLGYRATRWFAAEIQYEWMEAFDFTLGPFVLGDLATHTFMANAKFIVPADRIQPYLALGLGTQIAVLDSNLFFVPDRTVANFAGRAGVGVDFYLTRSWLLNLEVAGVLPASSVQSGLAVLDQLFYVSGSAGIQYRF